MLSQLSLNNFVIVEQLTLEFTNGMTALTGETGAGKSILIDALALVLGGRGNTNIIREGCERADINAIFSLETIPDAQKWLLQQELSQANKEVLLRRIINKDGRSRHFINGAPCTQQQMRQLGELLLNIHGQHEHQNLLHSHQQREILDDYAQHSVLIQKLKNLYREAQQKQQQLQALYTDNSERQAKLELLNYQVQELQALNLSENEFSELEQEHKQLAHGGQLQQSIQQALTILEQGDTNTVFQQLSTIKSELDSIAKLSPSVKPILELLNSATIQLTEANNELQHCIDSVEIDPERLFTVEQRLNQLHDVARKHHIEPEALIEKQHQLEQALHQLEHTDEFKNKLTNQLQEIKQQYQTVAKNLTVSREAAAKKLSDLVTKSMQNLSMKGGQFTIQLTPLSDEFNKHGNENIEFLVAANPGQALQPLNKVASGGEMSRISLALQMITAQKDNTPTLIFDEVDVGIGGATAEVIGKLLRKLGNKAQVLCITHLPQVAAQAHQHLQVQKSTKAKQTTAKILILNQQLRIEEIARMLGGINITPQTLKHAEEMLTQSNS